MITGGSDRWHRLSSFADQTEASSIKTSLSAEADNTVKIVRLLNIALCYCSFN